MSNRQNRPTGLTRLKGLISQVQDTQAQPAETPEQPGPASTTGQPYLIVGLGNPGKGYANNRHNIGFMLVDRLAERLGVRFSRMQARALVADTRYEGRKIIFAKPQTFMNESGQAVAALVKFYKIPPTNLLVAYDEMDVPLGTIRIRPKGGSGGQKGMKSIIEKMGNLDEFPRIRLGIGRPPGRTPPPAYLLQDFALDEQTVLGPRLEEAADAVLAFVTNGLNMAMNRYNGTPGEE